MRKPQPPRVIVHGHRSYGRLRPSLQPRQCRLRCARAARWHSSLALTGCAHMQPGSGAASTDQPAAATLAPAGARARRLWPRNSASSTDATGGGCADQPKVDSVAPSLPWVQFLLARPLGACTLAEPVVLGQCSASARPLARRGGHQLRHDLRRALRQGAARAAERFAARLRRQLPLAQVRHVQLHRNPRPDDHHDPGDRPHGPRDPRVLPAHSDGVRRQAAVFWVYPRAARLCAARPPPLLHSCHLSASIDGRVCVFSVY